MAAVLIQRALVPRFSTRALSTAPFGIASAALPANGGRRRRRRRYASDSDSDMSAAGGGGYGRPTPKGWASEGASDASDWSDGRVHVPLTRAQQLWQRMPHNIRHMDFREVLRDVVLTNLFIPAATFSAYASADVFDMRFYFLCGSVANVVMLMLHPNLSSKAPIFWTVVFASFNLFNLLKMAHERKQVAFSEEALDVYESAFAPHGVSPRQFSRLLRHCSFHTVYKGERIAAEGAPVLNAVFLVNGTANLITAGRLMAALPPHSFATSLSVLLPKPAPAPRPVPVLDPPVPVLEPLPGVQTTTQAPAGREPPTASGTEVPTAEGDNLDLLQTESVIDAEVGAADAEHDQAAPMQPPEPVPVPAPTPSRAVALVVKEGRISSSSVTLSSPSGRVMLIPISGLKEEVAKDPSLRTPLLSLAAAETAQRLAWTQGGMSRIQRYRQRLQAAVAGSGGVNVGAKAEAAAYAERHTITPDEHAEALQALGWTVGEYEAGFSGAAFRAAAARATRDAGSYVWDSISSAGGLFATQQGQGPAPSAEQKRVPPPGSLR